MELNTLNAINWIFEDTFNGSMAMKNSKEKVADLVLYNHCNKAHRWLSLQWLVYWLLRRIGSSVQLFSSVLHISFTKIKGQAQPSCTATIHK